MELKEFCNLTLTARRQTKAADIAHISSNAVHEFNYP
jgi:hypothetical protein